MARHFGAWRRVAAAFWLRGNAGRLAGVPRARARCTVSSIDAGCGGSRRSRRSRPRAERGSQAPHGVLETLDDVGVGVPRGQYGPVTAWRRLILLCQEDMSRAGMNTRNKPDGRQRTRQESPVVGPGTPRHTPRSFGGASRPVTSSSRPSPCRRLACARVLESKYTASAAAVFRGTVVCLAPSLAPRLWNKVCTQTKGTRPWA